ncbi:MAG TPA: glycosyltransferase [Steroidobacteraceae bacterium]|jgi:glycosyltransferase involved in cell wall biosynthesis
MNLTVAICTWNRAPLLRRTLDSLAIQRALSDVTWELLVVNNNCTDETDAVVSAFTSRLPIRGLHEPNPGLSNARNKAVADATGDYIVWTDDDVVVCPEWLSAYARAFRAWPDHAVFGGPIRPEFEGKPPDWLLSVWPRIQSAYAIRDIDPASEELAIVAGKEPFGANFSVRSDLQRAHPFDAQLGKSPDHPSLGGEEAMVIRELLGTGHQGRWVPDAVVHHWVPRTRQTTRHIRDYWRGYGAYKAASVDFAAQSSVLGVPRWIIRARVEYEIRYRAGRVFRKPDKWIHDLMQLGFAEGQLAYVREHRPRTADR